MEKIEKASEKVMTPKATPSLSKRETPILDLVSDVKET
jgi:hypothetical protein